MTAGGAESVLRGVLSAQRAEALSQQLDMDRIVDPVSGRIADADPDGPDVSVSFEPVPLTAGTVIRPLHAGEGGRMAVYFYRPDIDPPLIHTYTYQPEANWTTYDPSLSAVSWTADPYTVPLDGYVRIAVTPAAGRLGDAVRIEQADGAEKAEGIPGWMVEEVRRTADRVRNKRQSGDLTVLLLSDTHYTAGCDWAMTAAAVTGLAGEISPDAAVHLGDLTDGMLTRERTLRYADRVLGPLRALGIPLYLCLGNHDANYFRGNSDALTVRETAEHYLGRKKAYYHVDDSGRRLRMLFLDSFDPTRGDDRYGFSLREVVWIARMLITLPRGWHVLVFSHVTPASENHVWSRRIYRGEEVLTMMKRFDRRRGGAVLGWICGHNHADQVLDRCGFPIITVGCTKLEDFPDHKPEGAYTAPRARGTRTQELWDVLLVRPGSGALDLVRFGAGYGRSTWRTADGGMQCRTEPADTQADMNAGKGVPGAEDVS